MHALCLWCEHIMCVHKPDKVRKGCTVTVCMCVQCIIHCMGSMQFCSLSDSTTVRYFENTVYSVALTFVLLVLFLTINS
jgi:hypothetical protein